MRALWVGSSLMLFLAGCMANDTLGTTAAADKNVYNLSKVSLGMNADQVRQIMRQPYRTECFEKEGNSYQVWFYVTQPTILGQSRMVAQNLTPLTFKNGELVGWGYNYYRWLKQPEKNNSSQEIEEPAENRKLEKALEPSSNKSKAPVQTSSKNGDSLTLNSQSTSNDPASESQEESKEEPKEKNPPLDEEDTDFIEGESEQNFNFW